MAIVRVNIGEGLLGQATALIELTGAEDLKGLLKYCLQRELDRQRPFLFAADKKEEREKKLADKYAQGDRWSKLPDTQVMKSAKRNYKWMADAVVSHQQNGRKDYNLFGGLLDEALRNREWDKINEWYERRVWAVLHGGTEDDRAYREKVLKGEIV